jgi:chromosome segregation ATPase
MAKRIKMEIEVEAPSEDFTNMKKLREVVRQLKFNIHALDQFAFFDKIRMKVANLMDEETWYKKHDMKYWKERSTNLPKYIEILKQDISRLEEILKTETNEGPLRDGLEQIHEKLEGDLNWTESSYRRLANDREDFIKKYRGIEKKALAITEEIQNFIEQNDSVVQKPVDK